MCDPNELAASNSENADRAAAWESFGMFDGPSGKAVDDLTELAAQMCGAPMALVSVIDDQRQWFKSGHGVGELTETSRADSFCVHTWESDEVLEVSDTLQDDRFRGHPLVVGEPFVRFYAGAPLRSSEGHALGALCVLDVQPRQLDAAQRRCLRVLAGQVMDQLEMRRQAQVVAVEVAARVASEAALANQQRILEAVLEHTDVLIYAKDLQGRFVMTSTALEHLTRAPGGLLGRTDHDLFDQATAEEYRRNDGRIVATGERQVFSEDLLHPDGSSHVYRSTKFPLLDEDGTVLGVAGVSTDVTELVDAQVAHQQAEHRWRSLIEQSSVAMLVLDDALQIIYLNPQAETLCSGLGERLLDRLTSNAVDCDDSMAVLLAAVLAGGKPLRGRQLTIPSADHGATVVEVHAARIHYRGGVALQMELRDVTDVVAVHAELERHAHTDPLTGLLNRRGWAQHAPALLDRHDRRHSLVVAVIDLDRFKAYNDHRGHDAGDQLLVGFADAVRGLLGGQDVLARWGGEEFVMAIPSIDVHHAHQVLSRVRASVPDGQTCSIGYTCWHSPEALGATVARADAALYQAKDCGRDQLTHLAHPDEARHLPGIIHTSTPSSSDGGTGAKNLSPSPL